MKPVHLKIDEAIHPVEYLGGWYFGSNDMAPLKAVPRKTADEIYELVSKIRGQLDEEIYEASKGNNLGSI